MTKEENSKITTSSAGAELKARATFDEINKRVKSQPELVKKVGAVIVFDITRDGKSHQSCSTINAGKPQEGTTTQVTITVDDKDFVDLALGKADAPVLFAKGEMKVKGNVMLA